MHNCNGWACRDGVEKIERNNDKFLETGRNKSMLYIGSYKISP